MTLETASASMFNYFIRAPVGHACREYNVVLTGNWLNLQEDVVFRNPTLFPIQVVGMLIGLIIGVSINKSDGMSAAYSHAFLNFAGMNIFSILGHCIGHPKSAVWRFGIDIDVAFTGASCICLVLAALNSKRVLSSSARSVRLVAPACILIILWNTHIRVIPFLPELMYLGNLAVAFLVLFWHYTSSYYQSPNYFAYISLGAIGLLIAVIGAVFENKLCRLSTGVFSSICAVFFGCCVAFMSVYFFAFELEAKKVKEKCK